MSSEKYLLNVRNPQFFYPVFKLIKNGMKTEKELREWTHFPENALEETLTALRLYGMVEKRSFSYHTNSFQFGDRLRNPFKFHLLHNVVSSRKDGDEWSKKAAIPLVYAYLLKEDIEYFRYSDNTLIRDINNYHVDELGFEPKSSQGHQELRREKFNNWAKQARLLGLIHKARGSEHTVYPEPGLILDSLELAFEECNHIEESTIGIADFLEWLHENLLYIPFEDATVPKPLARTLFILARRGIIQLTRSGDPGSVNVRGIPTQLDAVRERTNSIHLVEA